MKPWPTFEAKIGALQAQVSNRGLFLEGLAVFGLAAHDRGETQPPPLSDPRSSQRDVDAALAQRDRHSLRCGPRCRKLLPRGGQELIDLLIGRIRIVVEQDQVLRLYLSCDLRAFEPTRMAPTLPRGRELLGRVLRVVDQDVCAAGELPEIRVEFRRARLVVRRIDDGTRRRVQPIAKAALWVVEPCGRYLRSFNVPLLAAGNLAEFAFGAHRGDVDRKIGLGELRFEHLAQAVWAEVLRLKAEEMKSIPRVEEGVEKRNTLNVIPVVVRHQHLCLNPGVVAGLQPLVAEHPQSRAAIEDESRAIRSGKLEARRVPAIAPGVTLESGDGASHAPENQFGRLRHFKTVLYRDLPGLLPSQLFVSS